MSTLIDAAPRPMSSPTSPAVPEAATRATSASSPSWHAGDADERSGRARRTAELYAEIAAAQVSAAPDSVEAARLLDEVVLLNVAMAESIAARYRNRGIDDDDLAGVARLALVKAAQRFDPDTGHDFHSYAVPSIRGEVKRHFRDHGWMVRPPRRIQETQAAIASAETALHRDLGRPPRPSDLAQALDLDLADVEEALAARGCFTPTSLDLPVNDTSGDGDMLLGDLLPHEEQGLAAAEARATLGPLIRQLNDRDRRVLAMRFFDGATQSEIAADIGVSQMHVSRLLARIYADLRKAQAEPAAAHNHARRR